jgi:hypothetical protein
MIQRYELIEVMKQCTVLVKKIVEFFLFFSSFPTNKNDRCNGKHTLRHLEVKNRVESTILALGG